MADNLLGEDISAPEEKSGYQVLALKYRPQTFDDLVGQEHVKTALANAIKLNKVAHSFLFAGSRGTGKTTSARILAKALNCLSSDGPTATPCGTCSACKEITTSRDLDVLEIDGASNNGVDQIRDLRSTIENKPSRDRYRVVIIDEVHMLSTAAFNALLKTLEEPPAHVKFIFATTDPHKVPETIHSRCQHYDFRRLTVGEIVGSLRAICEKEGINAGAGVLEAIAALVEGGMRDGQSKLDQLIAFRGVELKLEDVEQVFGLVGRPRLLSLVEAFRENKSADALDMAEELFSKGKDLSAFVGSMLHLLRDLLVVQSCGGDYRGLDLLPDERERMGTEASQWKQDGLLYAIDIFSDAGRKLKTADFPRVVLESALLKLCNIANLRPMRDVVSALDAILRGKVKLQTQAAPASAQAASAPEPAAPAPAPEAKAKAKTSAKKPADAAPASAPAASPAKAKASSPQDKAAVESAKDLIGEVFKLKGK